MPVVLPFIVGMVVTMAWLPVLVRAAIRWSFVDLPGTRKVHALPVPRVGGLAMLTGVFAAAAIAIPVDRKDEWFLGSAALLAVFGALDDRLDLDYRLKLAGQCLAVAGVLYGGDVLVGTLTMVDRVVLPHWLSLPLTFVFLVGVTNAVNLADGLDGLAGGTTFLCLCAIALLSGLAGTGTTVSIAAAFAGAVLGFLRFNTHPARVFMGDAGSQVLGLAIGVLSVRATQNPHSQLSTALPVLLLAIPILDTLSVMVQRIAEGRSPFSADQNHIHHKLLALGFRHHEAVIVIYVAQATLFLLGYFLRYATDLMVLGCVSVIFLAIILALQFAANSVWRVRRVSTGRDAARPGRAALRAARAAWLSRWSNRAIALALSAYAVSIVLPPQSVAANLRPLELALFVVLIGFLLVYRRHPLGWVEKVSIYTTIALCVFLDSSLPQGDRVATDLRWAIVAVAALATAIRLRLNDDRRFELTPLDAIVLFMVLVVPNLPEAWDLPTGSALAIGKLCVLFYALETLVSRLDRTAAWVRIATASLLAALYLRPLLPI
ncbi:MAG: undecaprenyl/decaprenyl-phosphate alpha-N-acetylglucosaminyl 1-phosphate transferase [Gammaproteobacteria bacterium]|nr:undecaprenyl/decaprenyl-phosphate alpha-N-acetylglucosaminyl 1-phosphate transferase [Gammaproteobacteria bacterium]